MSIEAMIWARDQRVKNVTIKCILLLLSDYAHPETNEAYGSLNKIATQAEVSVASVQRALKWLEENTFLTKIHRREGQRNLPNNYILNLSKQSFSAAQSEQLTESMSDLLTCSNDNSSPAQSLSSKQDLRGPKGPLISEDKTAAAAVAAEVKAPKLTKLEPFWNPDPKRVEDAKRKHGQLMDIDDLTRRFKERALAKGLKSFNWQSDWEAWIRTSYLNYTQRGWKNPYVANTEASTRRRSDSEITDAICSGGNYTEEEFEYAIKNSLVVS